MSDDELFAVLSEIADEEIMARNRASIIEVGKRIRRAALEEAIQIIESHQVPVGNSAAGDDIKALAAHVKEQADALYEVEHPERTAKLYLASKAITTLSDQLTAKTELATLCAASLRQSEEEVEGLRRYAWQPIETAPKTSRTLLLGYPNALGKWRTVRGEWISQACIDEQWEEPDDAEPGWYETSVEADDPPNCWPITPTHWMPLPSAPTSQTKE